MAESSLAAEVQGASEAQEETEFTGLLLADLLFGTPPNLQHAADNLSHIPGALVLDVKALWDCLSRSEPSALGMNDTRVAIEALALKRSLLATATKLA